MPTLEDARVMQTLAGANVVVGDYMYIYDESTGIPKKITIAELIVALDALDAGALAVDA